MRNMATPTRLPAVVIADALSAAAKRVSLSITNPVTRALYGKALDDLLKWLRQGSNAEFTADSVRSHCAWLLDNGYAASTVNQRLSAIRKLALNAAEHDGLSIEHAAGILRIKGERRKHSDAMVSLSRQQTEELLGAPNMTVKGLRDRAILALLIGCGLRRGEVASLECTSLEQRQGRWVLTGLVGRNGRTRTVPVPAWVKTAIDEWLGAAGVSEGALFVRLVHGKAVGSCLSPQTILDIVSAYGRELGMNITPEDLRRTCGRLCRSGGGELEQIQLLLGHARIQITEHYLGRPNQNLRHSPNDRIVLRFSKKGRQANA